MDGVHPDAIRGVEQGVGLAHEPDGALGGMVRRYVRGTHQAVDGGEVDDAAPARAAHRGDRMLRAEEHPFHVDRLHPVPLGLGEFVRRLVDPCDAGIVDQHIDAAERGDDVVDGAAYVGLAGDVHMPVAGRVSGRGKLVGERATFFVQHVEEGDARTFLRHAGRAGAADAARRSGDDAGLAEQSVHGDPGLPQRVRRTTRSPACLRPCAPGLTAINDRSERAINPAPSPRPPDARPSRRARYGSRPCPRRSARTYPSRD